LVFFFQTVFFLLQFIWNLILGVFEIIYKLISPFISWFPKALTSESAFDLVTSWTILLFLGLIMLLFISAFINEYIFKKIRMGINRRK